MQLNKVGIFSFAKKKGTKAIIQQLINHLAKRQIKPYIAKQISDVFADNFGEELLTEQHLHNLDLMFSIGGDGNFLHACREYYQYGFPILGVHSGRLGFLTNVIVDELEQRIEQIINGEFHSSQRSFLNGEIQTLDNKPQSNLALNDIVLHSAQSGRMIEFAVFIDSEQMCSMRADGFIVTSTTGSTAYALSAGGAILHPGLDGLELIPVAAHLLSSRPVVIPADKTVSITYISGSQAKIAFDGIEKGTLNVGQKLVIKKAQQFVNILDPSDYSFFSACRAKLGWLNKGS